MRLAAAIIGFELEKSAPKEEKLLLANLFSQGSDPLASTNPTGEQVTALQDTVMSQILSQATNTLPVLPYQSAQLPERPTQVAAMVREAAQLSASL